MKYSIITVAAAIPEVRVAGVAFNTQAMLTLATEAAEQGAEILVFPELSTTGYTCQDLFRQQLLLRRAEEAIQTLARFTASHPITLIVGTPVKAGNTLLNCGAVLQGGHVAGIVAKTFLPNYGEFYEKRWFASAADIRRQTIRYASDDVLITPRPQLFSTPSGARFGVELCEDVWAPVPPSNTLALAGADIICNLSASDELIGKHAYLKSLLAQQSARLLSGYIYAGSGFGESTQDVVYGGNAIIYENGRLLAEAKRFALEPQLMVQQIDIERLRAERSTNTTFVNAQRPQPFEEEPLTIPARGEQPDDNRWTLLRQLNPHPFIPLSASMKASCEEIFSIQVCGLAKRLRHTHCEHVVIGISGGLDSTLALLVCVRTFDKLKLSRRGIIGVTMPGFGTTDRTYRNALDLMESLGISTREISIAKAVTQHFADIGHDAAVHDVTYENAQARERTQLLMDISNQVGGLVIGTGDLSELALGWCTYNGDHMSMYGVNVSIPKTLIKYLVRYVAESELENTAASNKRTATEILFDVIDTPISPELTPADENGQIKQKTEDLVGPYELHDFFLYYFLRFGFEPEKIFMLACHAFCRDDISAPLAVEPDAYYSRDTIRHWLRTFYRRFFSQQFKRSCLPDGPKVGSVSLSPRGDWRMPSDAVAFKPVE